MIKKIFLFDVDNNYLQLIISFNRYIHVLIKSTAILLYNNTKKNNCWIFLYLIKYIFIIFQILFFDELIFFIWCLWIFFFFFVLLWIIHTCHKKFQIYILLRQSTLISEFSVGKQSTQHEEKKLISGRINYIKARS